VDSVDDYPNLNDDAIPSDQFPWVAAMSNNTWRPSGPEDADRPRYPGISVPTRGNYWDVLEYAHSRMWRAGIEEDRREEFLEEAVACRPSGLSRVLARWFTLADGTAVADDREND
jgi:hypothetical protein